MGSIRDTIGLSHEDNEETNAAPLNQAFNILGNNAGGRNKTEESIVPDCENGHEFDDEVPDILGFQERTQSHIVEIAEGAQRNGPRAFPFIKHSQFPPSDSDDTINPRKLRLKQSDTVELGGDDPNVDNSREGDFLQIHDIIEDVSTEDFFLRGWRLRRNTKAEGMLEMDLNEVHIKLDVDEDDPRPPLSQGMETISIYQAYKKRNMIITNALFPQHSFREHTYLPENSPNYQERKTDIELNSELVCRWIVSFIYGTSKERQNSGKIKGWCLSRIEEEFVDPEYRVSDKQLTIDWRGPKVRDEYSYSFIDAFCGAGGVTEAATSAYNEEKILGFDCDRSAIETNRTNHPKATFELAGVDNFLVIAKAPRMRASQLHTSTSCRPFSSNNTQVGRRDPNSEQTKRDEEAQNTSLTIEELLECLRPYYATLENTSCLTNYQRNAQWLRAIIRQYTDANYSLRGIVIDFAEFGVPSHRKRFIIQASAPGVPLPRPPKPTHGPRGIYPFNTINDLIADLPIKPPHHVPAAATPRDNHPYSPHTLLKNIVTTKGTKVAHPCGTRTFTVTEHARLQTCPRDYKFPHKKTTSEQQIGDMVPPLGALKVLIEPVAEALAELESRLAEEPGQFVHSPVDLTD